MEQKYVKPIAVWGCKCAKAPGSKSLLMFKVVSNVEIKVYLYFWLTKNLT